MMVDQSSAGGQCVPTSLSNIQKPKSAMYSMASWTSLLVPTMLCDQAGPPSAASSPTLGSYLWLSSRERQVCK